MTLTRDYCGLWAWGYPTGEGFGHTSWIGCGVHFPGESSMFDDLSPALPEQAHRAHVPGVPLRPR